MDFQALSIEELVRECARNLDDQAWTEFDRRFRRLIAKVIVRVCRECSEYSLEVAQDLVQDTYAKLLGKGCSLLLRFQPQHDNAFLGFIQTVAANVAYDHFRYKNTIKRRVELVELNEAIHVAGIRGPMTPEDLIFSHEIDALIAQHCDGPDGPRDQMIFWLHYRVNMTAKEISEMPGINLSVKGVESVIFRLTSFLRRSLVPV